MLDSRQNKQFPRLSDQDLGDAAFSRGDLSGARQFYTQALREQPSSSLLEYNLAEVARQQGDIDQAVFHYANSLELEPFYNSPFIQLLFLGTTPEQLDRVASLYQKLAQQQAEPWANVRLGDILTKQGRVERAIQSYQAASYKLISQDHPSYGQKYWQVGDVSQPSYIVIGPMKTATSALYKYINQHPKVLPSIKKEIHFFSDPSYLKHGPQWYLSHFPKIKPNSGFITGEASPGYLVNLVQDKVFSLFPNVKLIALTREPVERAYSHYTHNSKHGFERRSFSEAVEAELKVLESQDIENPETLISVLQSWNWSAYPGYIILGLYECYLRQWCSIFPEQQILIIQNQVLLKQPAAVMDRVFQFLDIEPFRAATYPKHNAGSYQTRKIEHEIASRLQNFFMPYEERLRDFLRRRQNFVVEVPS